MPDLEVFSSHSEAPFGSKPRQYFLTPELSQRLNLIRHLIQNSEQLLLVLAEAGCGKTSLLSQLKKVAGQQCEHWWLYTLVSSPALSPETLISEVLVAFNVRQDGKPTQVLQESLRSHIAATRYNGQLPVLFVDDAHLLPLATLRLIVELAMQGEPLTRMRVALFCEPQMTSVLATPEFDIVHNTLIHSLDIPPFSQTQVRDYLQFRLQNSRYSNVRPFSSDFIKKIYAESEGIPGEINLAAQQVLRQFVETRTIPKLPHFLHHPKWLWGIPVIMILIGIVLLGYWKYPELLKTFSPEGERSPLSLESQPPLALPNEEEVATSMSFSEAASTSSPLTSLSSHSESIEPFSATSFSDQNSGESEESTDLLGQPTEIKGEDWLRRQNPNSYTLQILGAHDRLTLKTFLEQHDLDEIAMFKTSYHNRDWYVLVYGVYPSRSYALAALEGLPPVLREATQPWVRSLATVQELIH